MMGKVPRIVNHGREINTDSTAVTERKVCWVVDDAWAIYGLRGGSAASKGAIASRRIVFGWPGHCCLYAFCLCGSVVV